MKASQPWQVFLVSLAGWVNRHQLDVIAYLQEENKVLKSKLKDKRIRFTDDERTQLAVIPRSPEPPGIDPESDAHLPAPGHRWPTQHAP